MHFYILSINFCKSRNFPLCSNRMNRPMRRNMRLIMFVSGSFRNDRYMPNVKRSPNAITMYSCNSIDAPSLHAISCDAIIIALRSIMNIEVPT